MPARFPQRAPWGMVFFLHSLPFLKNAPYNSPRHQWKQRALTDYLPPQPILFWISLAFGRATLFLSSLLVAFSQGYIFYILKFKMFQGRICVSLEYLFEVLRFSSYSYKTEEAYRWGKTFLDWKDILTLIVTVKGDFTAIHITSHPCSWHQSNLCCLSKRRLGEIHYSVLYKEQKMYFQKQSRAPHLITSVFKKKHWSVALMSYCYFLKAQIKRLVLWKPEISKQPCPINTAHQTSRADFWFSWRLRIYITVNSHAYGHIQSGNE